MANAFLANLGHLVFKVFGEGGGMDPLMVPPSIVLASVFTLGSDSQCAEIFFFRI